LISRYPAISHTFILREVLELRKRGLVFIDGQDTVESAAMPLARALDEVDGVAARETVS